MSAVMQILPRSSRKDTVPFEFQEREFTISGEVDRSGFVHEAYLLAVHLDEPGQDPVNITEQFRKSTYYKSQIVDFISTYDWVSRHLTQCFGDRKEET